MNRNYKVITVNGIRGIIAAVLIIFGVISGFIVSPGWVCMTLWNRIFENTAFVSTLNIGQGILLWVIIALSLYAFNNNRMLIGFGTYKGLTPEQIKDVMERAKEAGLKPGIRSCDDISLGAVKRFSDNAQSSENIMNTGTDSKEEAEEK